MSASVRSLFGAAPADAPADPGTYGEIPRGFRLPAATTLGPVRLQVGDLDAALAFYQGTLGFACIARDGPDATLAARDSDRPLVRLHANPAARGISGRGRLGLYHVAILLPDRAALGRFVRHLADVGVRAGAADHLVSEAFYLTDPDGLGIEVYADRPRDAWRRSGRELMMATDPVDVPSLLAAAGDTPWDGLPTGTRIGHVHLHVGDLAAARAFYSEALGFDRTVWRYPGALFLSAGGYHHHLGTNTWAGPGATPPTPDAPRLLEWTVELPGTSDVEAAGVSLRAAGITIDRESEGAFTVADPWGTRVRVHVR